MPETTRALSKPPTRVSFNLPIPMASNTKEAKTFDTESTSTQPATPSSSASSSKVTIIKTEGALAEKIDIDVVPCSETPNNTNSEATDKEVRAKNETSSINVGSGVVIITSQEEAARMMAKLKKPAKEAKESSSSKKKSSRNKQPESESDSSESSDSETSDDSESEEDSDSDTKSKSESSDSSASSEDESRKSKRSKKVKKATKSKRSKKSKKDDSDSDDSDSEKEEDKTSGNEADQTTARSDRLAIIAKLVKLMKDQETGDADDESNDDNKKEKKSKKGKKKKSKSQHSSAEEDSEEEPERNRAAKRKLKARRKQDKESSKKASSKKPTFYRADEIWSKENHQFELHATNEKKKSDDHDKYCFTIRRKFEWDGKFECTYIDIHSQILKGVLGKIMANCKAVSFSEETPSTHPDNLFLYIDDIRAKVKSLKKKMKRTKSKKSKKLMSRQQAELKVVLKYLDKDYAKTKASLYPLLKAGKITFNLLWTIFKSDTIAYTSTYSAPDEPRAFKVDMCVLERSLSGYYYDCFGQYFDYDGKNFGMGDVDVRIHPFRGARKISSLPVYPIKYHQDEEGLRKTLIERGKKFVSLSGMQYKFLKGLAFTKRKKQYLKVNVNGRVMCDPGTFRRVQPNYQFSTIKPKDPDLLSSDEDDGSDGGCCVDDSDDDEGHQINNGHLEVTDETPRYKRKVLRSSRDCYSYTHVEVDEDGDEIGTKKSKDVKAIAGDMDEENKFTDEEYLIASPVILGFAFTEKLWLEFVVSGIHDIEWNEGAFDSLVLPETQKSMIKALVTAHTSEAENKNIDDVIQGKGKGLVAVLHGSPGTGKTLTAEGIAEVKRCPLYCVSAGELGLSPRELEAELTKILDVAHSWGAVLLLDEADVFLEARTSQDIHRNALVSIFLRMLEYFQGILFLTTNRVNTFDEAFQSRIHIALRYNELDFKARRTIFKMFIDKVKALEGGEKVVFTEEQIDRLAKKANLNGRQIKNSVRSAQAIALTSKETFSMKHIEMVLGIAAAFEQDLKGGTGYMDAMRSYN